ncbi:ABC transporter permease [Romboutsia sp.]|uniref:ABC transporter permease n=1 Tax=Romboutsia sp. TaxID=1965302 RepID=UPI003F410709
MNIRKFATNNIVRNSKSYLGYFFSILISSSLIFSYNMFMNHPDLDMSKFSLELQRILEVTNWVAYVFLLLFVFYSASAFLKSRYKDFGTLYILGSSKKQLQKMILIENLIINAISSTVGVIVGLIFSKVFLIVVSRLIGLEPLKFYIPTEAIVSTIIYFIVLAILISLFASIVVKENQVLKLLKESKKPKAEPKTSPILAILCVVLLIAGYYQSVTVTKRNLINRIVPVTAMVIVATYLIFSQLSVFFINKLKTNRKYYMNGTSMLWISNLSYKIKDNTRMFFLITITSAVAFSAIGTGYSFWKDIKRQVELSFPQSIYYSTHEQYDINGKPRDKNKHEERIKYIEDGLQKEGIKYSKENGEIKKIFPGKNTSWDVTIIKESDYRKIAENLGIEPIDFKNNESVSLTLEEIQKLSGDVTINNNKLKVIRQIEKTVMPAYYSKMYVVKDEFYNSINTEFTIDKFTTFNVEDYNSTLDLVERFKDKYEGESGVEPYIFFSRADMLQTGKVVYSTVLFLGIFIGLIFFVTSSSFLYNKFYMDCQEDKKKYVKLNKIGLTYKEIKKISTIEIGVLFLFPYIVAVIHSIFALTALKRSFDMEVATSAFLVMGGFLILQVVYFYIVRMKYLKEIKFIIK